MVIRKLILLAIVPLQILISGCSAEIPNLTTSKARLYCYHDSGHYQKDVEKVAERAEKFARANANRATNSIAVVFDIDDTALSNWDYMAKIDFGYEAEHYEKWVKEGVASANSPVLKLYNDVHQLGLPVFFVTGRKEHLREITVINLNAAGYHDWTGLYMRPEADGHKTIGAYKTDIRREIEESGYEIIFNIGDQDSDFIGGYSDRNFKLPNPFYISE